MSAYGRKRHAAKLAKLGKLPQRQESVPPFVVPDDAVVRAYLAGIFDGEGCVYAHGGRSRHLFLSIANTNEALMLWLASFGGRLRPARMHRGGRMLIFEWHLYGRRALDFLRVVQPYLIVKKAQAELALTFYDNSTRGRWLTDKERGQRESIRVKLQLLKRSA